MERPDECTRVDPVTALRSVPGFQADNVSEKMRRFPLCPSRCKRRRGRAILKHRHQCHDQCRLVSGRTKPLPLQFACFRPERGGWKRYGIGKPPPFRKGLRAKKFRRTMLEALPKPIPKVPCLGYHWNRRTILSVNRVFAGLFLFSKIAAWYFGYEVILRVVEKLWRSDD